MFWSPSQPLVTKDYGRRQDGGGDKFNGFNVCFRMVRETDGAKCNGVVGKGPTHQALTHRQIMIRAESAESFLKLPLRLRGVQVNAPKLLSGLRMEVEG